MVSGEVLIFNRSVQKISGTSGLILLVLICTSFNLILVVFI